MATDTVTIEKQLQKELMTCPECGKQVHTVAAEGIPAQALRSGDCGHDFFMDLDSKPNVPVSIEQFIKANRISISSEYADRNPNMDGSADMDNYKVTLSRPLEFTGITEAFDVRLNGKVIDTVFQNDSKAEDIKSSLVNHDGYDPAITVSKRRVARSARMTLHFSKGTGHHGAEPTADEVLDCLASDAAGIENSPDFEDWCSEYGYDTDSRSAKKTFKACEHTAARLKNFLGDDLYSQLLWNTERN